MSTRAAKQAKRNATPVPCEIVGCDARASLRGLCRRHYDQNRYREGNGKRAEAQADVRREKLIDEELRIGYVADFKTPPETMECSMFASEEERREAWEQRRERLMQPDPTLVGERPWAWWEFEAGREQHLEPYPLDHFLDRDHWTEDEEAAAIDRYEIEPLEWMAANGYLTPEEIAAITEDANIARPRIGTDGEQIGSGGVDRVDRRAVRLYEAVTEALKPNPPT